MDTAGSKKTHNDTAARYGQAKLDPAGLPSLRPPQGLMMPSASRGSSGLPGVTSAHAGLVPGSSLPPATPPGNSPFPTALRTTQQPAVRPHRPGHDAGRLTGGQSEEDSLFGGNLNSAGVLAGGLGAGAPFGTFWGGAPQPGAGAPQDSKAIQPRAKPVGAPGDAAPGSGPSTGFNMPNAELTFGGSAVDTGFSSNFNFGIVQDEPLGTGMGTSSSAGFSGFFPNMNDDANWATLQPADDEDNANLLSKLHDNLNELDPNMINLLASAFESSDLQQPFDLQQADAITGVQGWSATSNPPNQGGPYFETE